MDLNLINKVNSKIKMIDLYEKFKKSEYNNNISKIFFKNELEENKYFIKKGTNNYIYLFNYEFKNENIII